MTDFVVTQRVAARSRARTREASFLRNLDWALLLAVAASAQDYKIRAKIDLVVVPVTVKGSGNKLITVVDGKESIRIKAVGRPR